uniref:Uncharacterized protein n=1 Tax=Anguilla anguilla TaxID=7936 RepID=A0A0E9XQK4_ANGAN
MRIVILRHNLRGCACFLCAVHCLVVLSYYLFRIFYWFWLGIRSSPFYL